MIESNGRASNTGALDRQIVARGLRLGVAGLLVQVLLLYLITRDRVITSILLAHFVPIAGTVGGSSWRPTL